MITLGQEFVPLEGDYAFPAKYNDPTDPITVLDAPIVVCFAAGTPESYINEIASQVTLINAQLAQTRYFLGPRWSGSQGAPRALTWSLVPDTLNIPNLIGEGAANSSIFARLDAQYSGQGGRATWLNRFEQCFARWAELSGTSYTRVTFGGNDWDDGASWGSSGSANRGDIRICMKPLDGAFGILAFNSFPSNGDMVMDHGESWGSSANQNLFLRQTVMHEHGHGLGFEHVCSNDRKFLMEPALDTTFDGPRLDGIRAVQRHYGDPYEPDNATSNPNDMGTLAAGGLIDDMCIAPDPQTGTNPGNFSLCSIDADGEHDYFSFDLTGAATITAIVDPVGSTYDDNQQNANGSCPTGNDTDSLSLADLAIEVIDTDGSTVLASEDANGIGVGEIVGVSLPSAGTYFIRIFEAGAGPSQTQLYDFSVSADAGCPDADGDGVCDASDACPGFDDNLDLDGDGIPDGCDCAGDVDNDGDVDITDLGIVLANFGSGGVTWAEGDTDGDGDVDITDLGTVLAGFGGACP
jgi:hypothetical protein